MFLLRAILWSGQWPVRPIFARIRNISVLDKSASGQWAARIVFWPTLPRFCFLTNRGLFGQFSDLVRIVSLAKRHTSQWHFYLTISIIELSGRVVCECDECQEVDAIRARDPVYSRKNGTSQGSRVDNFLSFLPPLFCSPLFTQQLQSFLSLSPSLHFPPLSKKNRKNHPLRGIAGRIHRVEDSTNVHPLDLRVEKHLLPRVNPTAGNSLAITFTYIHKYGR